jgi:hypothetical protein
MSNYILFMKEFTNNVVLSIIVSAIFLLASFTIFYFLVYRPRSLSWGATDEEVNRQMSGDHILEQPTFIATRAISIEASPEEIWPWIIQIGYKRAGFYSYDRLDNDGIHSSDIILPEYRGLRVGDLIPMTKEINAVVTELDPHRSMVMDFQPWVWSWGLYETDLGYTRLVTRVYYHTGSIISNFTVDAFEIIMMRKCLLGIKQRVEANANLSS